MINFNIPICIGTEKNFINEVIEKRKLCGDGEFTEKCSKLIEKLTDVNKCLLTTSGTSALEMSALLCDIHEGDEVILPSYTFTSTANAFVLHGARLVFVDVRPDTMNIDEKLIDEAINPKTKAICCVHYAGVSCEMDKITDIAKKHKLIVIEDAAQAIFSLYKGKNCGTIGRFGCLSFHETKNFSMGEGGAIFINDNEDIERAEILREKGTDRAKFFRGQVDKYTWQDKGSSFLPSELNVAYLYAELIDKDKIQNSRMNAWNYYNENLRGLENKDYIELMKIPKECTHNAHMFYIKTKNLNERKQLIDYLKKNDILTAFHYIPLHSSFAGLKYGRFNGEDKYTTKESERLLRLPLYYGIDEKTLEYVCKNIKDFYTK